MSELAPESPDPFEDRIVNADVDEDEDSMLEAIDLKEWDLQPEAFDDFLEVERRRKKLRTFPKVTPSQFVEIGFRMPADVGGFTQFSFEGRRHMRRPYDTPCNRVLLVTARQVEKSTLLGNTALTYSCLVPGHRALYVSPSATQTKTFSNDRLKEPIETSDILKAYTTTRLSMNVFEKQFINWAKITLRYAFLNADRVRGIPAWMLLLDEIQDIIADNIPVIEQCTGHAPEKWKRFRYAGTPKSLDNVIEYYRSRLSTQGEWVVPCDSCGSKGGAGRYWNILGEKNIGKEFLICERCGKRLNPQHNDAQWAFMVKWDPKNAPFESYRIPQLMVPWKKWSEILLDYKRYPRNQFYNEVLGLSFDSGMRPLTISQVREQCRPEVSMDPDALVRYEALGHTQDIFAGIDWGCYSEDTRTLTENGFKYYWEITESEKIAQYNPKTEEISYVTPKKKIVFQHDGEMIHFKSSTYDSLVTPDHKIYYRLGHGPWKEGQAQDVVGKDNVHFPGPGMWVGREEATFVVPTVQLGRTSQRVGGQQIPMDLWLQFLGLLLSEGGLCRNKGKPAFVVITQRDVRPDRVAFVKSVVEAMPFNHGYYFNAKTGDHQWKIYGKELWSWVADNLGDTPSTKRIPREFLSLSVRQLQHLYHALMLGDGTWDKRYPGNGAYYTTSSRLRDDVLELVTKLGYRGLAGLHKPAEGNRKDRYRVSISLGKDVCLHSRTGGITRVPYNGKAYCFSVDSGYFVTERNGRVALLGNTGENTYTVLSLGTYVDMKFRIFYVHRFIGEELEPPRQLEIINEICRKYSVALIGADYGGGFDRNDHLMRKFGPERVQKFQYMARNKSKVDWDPKLRRWKVHRTEVMSDIFNAVKRGVFEFPRWEEFQDPYAQDMCNIFSEYNESLRQIQYSHNPDRPDDAFHSILYCFLVSMIKRRRPDVIAPRREDPSKGQYGAYGDYGGPTQQG